VAERREIIEQSELEVEKMESREERIWPELDIF
jgi:hypothetical protein